MAEMEQEEEDYTQEGPQFANVMPRTREEREADKDKDGLEKLRLQDRKGGHYKFHGSANPIMPYKDSLSYIEESERFSTDAAAEEYDRRQRKLMEKEEYYERRRAATYAREETRWDKIEQDHQYNTFRQNDLKNKDLAQRNQSSVAYNPITLKYDDSYNGQVLQYNDQTIRFKAANRAQLIYQRQSSQDYDVISGKPRPERVKIPAVPEKPEKPEQEEFALGAIRMDLAYGDENLSGERK